MIQTSHIALPLSISKAHPIQIGIASIRSSHRSAGSAHSFAIVGLVLVSRISFIERSIGHDRLVIWHRKLGPHSLYLITFHVFLVSIGYYNCGFTTAIGAVSGATAILTIKTPSTTTGVNLTATYVVTVGGSTPGTETIISDSSTYAPGQQMLLLLR
jgi:predicted ferric reductase